MKCGCEWASWWQWRCDITWGCQAPQANLCNDNLRCGRGTPQILKEMIKAVGLETNNIYDIVYLGHVFLAMLECQVPMILSRGRPSTWKGWQTCWADTNLTEMEGKLGPVVLNRFLPLCFLCFSISRRWATLDDNMALVLGFAWTGEDLALEEGDIVIKVLELG